MRAGPGEPIFHYATGICGLAMTDLGVCSRRKAQREDAAQGLRARQGRKALWREIHEIVGTRGRITGIKVPDEDGWPTI